MKLNIKTLKGQHFLVEVESSDKVLDVKAKIEETQGRDHFPKEQLLLIHQGKVLKDDSTLEENKVSESGFVVVMLSKAKASPAATPAATTSAPPSASPAPPAAQATPAPPAPVAAVAPELPSSDQPPPSAVAAATASPMDIASPPPAVPATGEAAAGATTDIYSQAASNLVAGATLEPTVQQLIDMGGGAWDRDTVIRALRAAFNNPERAVDYLYSGIPEAAEIAPPVARAPAQQGGAAAPPPAAPLAGGDGGGGGGPNAAPLNLFPQGGAGAGGVGGGALDFLRDNPQFQRMRSMVQANPQMIPSLLQGLEKQNPELWQLISSHQMEFLRLISEPGEGDVIGEIGEGGMGVPQAIQITEQEGQAIERLEALGFARAAVIEAFFACDKDEQLAANYLLENGDFDD